MKVQDPSDDHLGELEHVLMTGFFSIRKLMEARTKLSSTNMKRRCKVRRYPIRSEIKETGPFPDLMNYHQLDKFYDFSKGSIIAKDLSYVCNQFIHSFVFSFMLNERGQVESVILSSDKEKKKFCHTICLSDAIEVFRLIGADYPSDVRMRRNENGEWQVVNSQ
ncbi:hypothetical protein ACFP4H_21155 [Pseudophaeobacter arcticus]|uniref:hypothetical protein n=1 Tax=Pseudophaeobacter arcticus TaxID=385492 RepID=UPI0012B55A74|nr:hypothetical protein [Pseudophaeobacter arcticus]